MVETHVCVLWRCLDNLSSGIVSINGNKRTLLLLQPKEGPCGVLNVKKPSQNLVLIWHPAILLFHNRSKRIITIKHLFDIFTSAQLVWRGLYLRLVRLLFVPPPGVPLQQLQVDGGHSLKVRRRHAQVAVAEGARWTGLVQILKKQRYFLGIKVDCVTL